LAIPELELRHAEARLQKFCERVPVHVRDQLRYAWSVRVNKITLFERRPPWRGGPGEWSEHPFARFVFDPEARTWALRCSDGNGGFHAYRGFQAERSFGALVDEVEADLTGIFLG